MKERLLFVGFSLKVGGIERALIEQLKSIDVRHYEVSLFLFSHTGAYMSEIPEYVHLLREYPLLSFYGLPQKEANKKWYKGILRALCAILVKYVGAQNVLKLILEHVSIKGRYDYAISYFHNGSLRSLYCGCNELVLKCVNANKKIAWIHSDYQIGNLNNEYNNKLYCQFDAVVNVSNFMKLKFDQLNIVDESRSYVVYNRYDATTWTKKSKDITSLDVSCASYPHLFSMVTVGRLEKEKGVDRLLMIASDLKKKGFIFKWFFVGTGVLDIWCKDFINDKGLNDCVVLSGQQKNSYPYYKMADITVSGSLSETFGLSIIESLTLKTPVIAYRYEAIDEILDSSNGIVCNTFEELEERLEEILKDQSIIKNLKNKTFLLQDYNEQNESQFKNLLDSI